ncbi:hypothetical protein AAHE18_19G036900 [Arachis hypogaea]
MHRPSTKSQKILLLICLNWSLIIICIPDKGDELGSIILHLDSLSLHSSISLFDNIKRLTTPHE